MYSVVEFLNDKSVADVAEAWFYNAGSTLWPKKHRQRSILLENNQRPPDGTKAYAVKVLKSGLTLEKARQAARRAQNTDNLSSSKPRQLGRGKRIRHIRKLTSDSDDEDSPNQQKEPTGWPAPPPILQCRRLVKEWLRQMQDACIDHKVKETQGYANRSETKDFLAPTKSVCGAGTTVIAPLLISNGTTLLMEKSQILERWAEHFRSVPNCAFAICNFAVGWLPQMKLNRRERWLREKLAPLSIADPTPLSQYIIALVKKDKPEDELQAFCIEQLEVFLQKNTATFVEDMFATLKSHASTRTAEASRLAEDCTKVPLKSVSRPRKPHRSRGSHSPSPDPERSTAVGKITQRSPNRRSRSPLDEMDKGKRQSHGDYKRHSNDDSQEYEEYSRSSKRLPSHVVVSSDKSAVETSHRPHRPRQSPERSPEHRERSVQRLERAELDRTRVPRTGNYDRDTRVRKGGSPRLRSALEEPTEVPEKRRKRCRYFDEQGFCILGDRCKFEHGSNALVVPNPAATALLSTLPAASFIDTALASGACLLPRPSPPDTTHELSTMVAIDSASVGADFQNNLTQERKDELNNIVYNPTPIGENASRIPSLAGPSTPVDGQRASTNGAYYGQNSNFFSQPQGRHRYPQSSGSGGGRFYGQQNEAQRSKNIIPVPLMTAPASRDSAYQADQDVTASSSLKTNSTSPAPPAYEPARPELSMVASSAGENTSGDVSTEYKPSPIARDSPMLSDLPQTGATGFPSAVLVFKLPWRLNNLTSLHNHFTRFGTVINVETNFMGQNSQALVEFSSPAEAEAAYRSPEPILSNRFIRLSPWPTDNNRRGHFHQGRFHGNRRPGNFSGIGFSTNRTASFTLSLFVPKSTLSLPFNFSRVLDLQIKK
nr:unnamed protein product [Spirometra erinaceieuropaei]